MTDERLERLLADLLEDTALSVAPDRLAPETIRAARRVRRWPRWLAFVKEPPMRISSLVAVGSPVVRLAYVAVLIFALVVLATGTVVGAASLVPGPATIVVAQDGTGSVSTITDAVALAEDGDTVLIRPGTYVESITIDRSITVRGDGPAAAVVIEFTLESPTVRTDGSSVPNGLSLVNTDAHVSDLTVRGPDGTAIWVSGGSPTIDGVLSQLTGESCRTCLAYQFTDGTTATVRDVTGGGMLQIDRGSSPNLERYVTDWGGFINDPASDPIISDSRFGFALDITGGAAPIIERNDMLGVKIQTSEVAVVRGNTFHNPDFQPGAEHHSSEEVTAVEVLGSDPVLVGNTVRDHEVGISVSFGSSPTIQDNVIEANTTGIAVQGSETSPVIHGNTFCGNDEDLSVPDGSSLTLDGNTVCAGAASAAP